MRVSESEDEVRLYVGTLHTIENEFEECVAAIHRQAHRNFKHFVFSGLGNEESHAALFGDFASKRDRFDLMVKIDADMVIQNEHLFEKIEAQFLRTDLKVLSIAVHDWFSDRLISGLNTYRNDISWRGDEGKLFVDSVQVLENERELDWDHLAPAALHCPNPSPFQAFHFGLHKAMKVLQPFEQDVSRKRFRMREHCDNITETARHFERSGDRRLGLAVLGAELAFTGCFDAEHVSYNHPETRQVFSRYGDLGVGELAKEIRRLRWRSGGWLPSNMRRAWLWYRFRRKHASLYALRTLAADVFVPPRTRL